MEELHFATGPFWRRDRKGREKGFYVWFGNRSINTFFYMFSVTFQTSAWGKMRYYVFFVCGQRLKIHNIKQTRIGNCTWSTYKDTHTHATRVRVDEKANMDPAQRARSKTSKDCGKDVQMGRTPCWTNTIFWNDT